MFARPLLLPPTQNDGGTGYMLARLHTRSNNPDRLLIKAFKCIQHLCEQLNLLKQVGGAGDPQLDTGCYLDCWVSGFAVAVQK